jgi:hypothetical protein
MSKWTLVALLGLQAHFAASYLVPLDERSRGEFGGLLRWFWPWAYGDDGPLGQLMQGADLPLPALFMALTGATLFLLAALAAASIWIPSGWWRGLAVGAGAIQLCLLALFFGPTKLIPMALALGTLYLALAKPGAFAID